MNYCEQLAAAGLIVVWFWGVILGWFADKLWQILKKILDL